MNDIHKPILLEESVIALDLKDTDTVIDGTMGYGGHSEAILEHIPNGHLIGIDQDLNAIAHCTARFKDHKIVSIFHNNFSEISAVLEKQNIPTVNKIMVDLGMSSFHLDNSERGFTFLKEEPLDMRMNQTQQLTAQEILNTYAAEKLEEIFIQYGEIRNPDKLIETIIHNRKMAPYETTKNLVDTIKKSFFFRNKRTIYMRTCAQVFQALRIEVNDEFGTLETLLNSVIKHLAPNGRAAFITFHSLEDRMVKKFFVARKDEYTLVSNKVLKPSKEERTKNSRSRSAKLRVYTNEIIIPTDRKSARKR
jgi:16S rRNA (cytosine1402-N4)-methyltransferase